LYREVPMVEVREVLRLWLKGHGYRRIAELVQADRKTVRRYVEAAQDAGLEREGGDEVLSDELLGTMAEQLQSGRPRQLYGEAWQRLEGEREFLKGKLDAGLRLTKVHDLLGRRGVLVPYRTLHRFCATELEFGGQGKTVRVADGEPGKELQVDFGRMGLLRDGPEGRRRMCWGLLFTACYSRHQFCWLSFRQTLPEVIEGFEQAWRYFGGVFAVVIPDSLKAIVIEADAIAPRFNTAFLEYAQARGFEIDPARVRSPQDKPRVERAVNYVRESGFRGEDFGDLDGGRRWMADWCLRTAGTRVHGTTQRRPLEVFEQEEKPHLLACPERFYEVPLYAEPKVHRDYHIEVARSLYSVPERYIGERVWVRADRELVRVYHRGQLIKVHPRMQPGQRSTDPLDLPQHKRAYAMRDIEYLQRVAAGYGTAVGAYAAKLLDSSLPWTRMRQVYCLLGLVRRYGQDRVERACKRALDIDAINVRTVQRVLERAAEESPTTTSPLADVLPLRFARSPQEFGVHQEARP
jgi:transposase